MIVGNDISVYQGTVDWPTYKNNSNFVIIKASEGKSLIDPWFGGNRKGARDNNLPRGFYHFARPDYGNLPEDEAKFFCSLIDGDPIRDGELLMLDFEVQFHDSVNWAKAWLDYVSNHFGGVKPLFYSYQSMIKEFDWSVVANNGYGLWIAAPTGDPNNNNFYTGPWKMAAMQQWGTEDEVPGIKGAVDADVFFGDLGAFENYGYKTPVPISIPTPEPIVSPVNEPVSIPDPVQSTPPVVTTPVESPVTLPSTPTQPLTPVNATQSKLSQFLTLFWNILKLIIIG